MAVMICGAIDWSFDEFVEDMRSVNALPMRRGVHSAKTLTERQQFCQHVKTMAKYFKEDYAEDNGIYVKDSYEYIGDAFANYLKRGDMCFSDWYKDLYNQRPHFQYQYGAMLCGLEVFGEVGFCGDGWKDLMEHEIDIARRTREKLEELAREEGE